MIKRVPIQMDRFIAIKHPALSSYTINMAGSIRDKKGNPVPEVILPHLPGPVVMFPELKLGGHPMVWPCRRLVSLTFYGGK